MIQNNIYPFVSYFLLIAACLIYLVTGCFFKKDEMNTGRLRLIITFVVVFIISCITVYVSLPYLNGVFAEPSALTASLSLCYLVSKLSGFPLVIKQKTLMWFGFCASFIVLLSLGMFIGIGLDFYHQFFDFKSILLHYALFAFVFIIGVIFDKRTIFIVWICLIAVFFEVMNSHFILDYIADVWLFILMILMLIRCAAKHFLVRKV